MAIPAAGRPRLPGPRPRQEPGHEPRSGADADQFAVLDHVRRPRRGVRDMISSIAKLDQISEDGIRQLVDAFYAKGRRDPELAPVLLRGIPGDWQPHLNKMYAFWSSVMLTTGRYKGNPLVKHLVIPGIRPQLFERWLALFNETCGELFDDGVSEEFRVKAARIAESLMLGLFYRPDRPWPAEPAT